MTRRTPTNPRRLARAGLWMMLAMLPNSTRAGDGPAPDAKVVLVVHGGAGTLTRREMTPEREAQYRAAIERALRAGYDVLRDGRSSVEAVEAAIVVLEDSPLFNAGKGAVFTHEGRHELDASIMEGSARGAGAVAAVTTVKNPIRAARAVMERSPHVMLVGEGADRFASESGLEAVENAYFSTEHRRKQLDDAIAEEQEKDGQAGRDRSGRAYLGTVGAVALDRAGHLAAGTSTGGMTNKRFGRVGDSPIIGAGTYADDEACAVSCTGHGEFFIRFAVAHEVASLVRHEGLPVAEAAERVIGTTLRQAGGEGGAIALDARGRAALAFNSEGMYRGYVTESGEVHVAIYAD